MTIRDVLREMMTESDNITHDLYRYLAVGSVFFAMGCQFYAIKQGQQFSMQDFGLGIGALFAGIGVALGLKKESDAAKSGS